MRVGQIFSLGGGGCDDDYGHHGHYSGYKHYGGYHYGGYRHYGGYHYGGYRHYGYRHRGGLLGIRIHL
jgi:hypothetical protein